MPYPEERLVNLALMLASTNVPVSAAECRAAGLGYPEDQDDVAFLRMFERDKDVLRSYGLAIEVVAGDDGERYRLNRAATYVAPVELSADEFATVRTAGAALASDPSFPFAAELTSALGKLGWAPETRYAISAVADEEPGDQASLARLLAGAAAARKTACFAYTNVHGDHKEHEVEPYGLFFREGRWYLVARDRSLDEIRVYALRRMDACTVNTTSPKTPDFAPPAGFAVSAYSRLPFQFGRTPFDAVVRFDPESAWRAERLASGSGTIRVRGDGAALWYVDAADADALGAWCLEHGPGIVPVAPEQAVAAFRHGLGEVLSVHDC